MINKNKIKQKIVEFRQANDKLRWLSDYVKWRHFTYQQKRDRPANLGFDLLHHVETAIELPLESVGVSQADAARGNSIYRPLTEKVFRAAIASLDIHIPDFTFVDIGSGKGKVLFMASELPFKRIVGVEYARGLHDVAVRNVVTFRSATQKCRHIDTIHADALKYRLPQGPLVLFTFNALPTTAMRQFLEMIDVEAGTQPNRAIVLVYTNLRSVKEIGNVFSGLANLNFVRRVRNYVVIANAAPGSPLDPVPSRALDGELAAPNV
jgi:hypothetical protein